MTETVRFYRLRNLHQNLSLTSGFLAVVGLVISVVTVSMGKDLVAVGSIFSTMIFGGICTFSSIRQEYYTDKIQKRSISRS